MIYNAGAYESMNARALDAGRMDAMLDVNYRGAVRMLEHVLPHFLARNAGRLVLVASVAAYRGLPNALGYGASKAALLHLAQNLRADLLDTGITVQVVNPGFVRTRLTAKNTFSMPFLLEPEAAARQLIAGMEGGRFEIHFPKRFTCVMKVLRLLPQGLYDAVCRKLNA